jgi:hypothetical protein
VGEQFPQPFQRFVAGAKKPFKRFQKITDLTATQLKQGVNEKSLAKSLLHAASDPNQFVLLTKANLLLSGDHEGTLIVPCPPYT